MVFAFKVIDTPGLIAMMKAFAGKPAPKRELTASPTNRPVVLVVLTVGEAVSQVPTSVEDGV